MMRVRCLLPSLWCLVTILACAAVGPDYQRPDIDLPAGWTRQLGGVSESDLSPNALGAWWRTIDDPILTELIDLAVASNLELRSAESRLRQARAERSRARGALFPTLSASVNDRDQGRFASSSSDGASELYSAGFDSAWELDVFGGLRRGEEAAAADEKAVAEDRRDVLVSVLAEVALNYTELRTFQAQLAITKRNLAKQEEALAIVQAQVSEGSATALDLESAKANAAGTRAEIPPLNESLVQAANRLSVLVGKPPGTLDSRLGPVRDLPAPAAEVAVGVPAQTLRRRPDVRAAERRLAAETARQGVAVAELYPKFVLNGSIGIESTSMSGLSAVYDIGPRIDWPIFSAGRIRRQIDIQDEVQEQALIEYESTVLAALEEVENAITAYAEEQVRLRELDRAAAASRQASSLATARYEAGLSPFLELLDAQRTALAAEGKVVTSRGKLVSNLVRLYKSLGGGWESLAGPREAP